MTHIFQNPIANLFQVKMNWNIIRTSSCCSDLKWKCMYQCCQVCITSGYYIMFPGLFFIMSVPQCLMPFESWKRWNFRNSACQINESFAVEVVEWGGTGMNVDYFLHPCSTQKHPAEVLFYNFLSLTSRKKKKSDVLN